MTVSRKQNDVPTLIHATMTRDVFIISHGRVITERDVMVLTRSQKEAEDVIFGPFSRMRLAEMPAPQALWDMIHAQIGSFKVQGKIGVSVFTQFIHWLAMQLLSKAFSNKTMTESLLADFNRGVCNGKRDIQVVSPMAAFEFCADMIDSVVCNLAPDLFRVIDHNGDDDLSRDEWVKFLDCITSIIGMSNTTGGDAGTKRETSDQVLDLVFTIIDKDNSKTLELDEMALFFSKILRIMVDLVRSAITTLGRSASEASKNDVVDSIVAALDKDGDGCLMPDEVFAGFCPPLLAVVMQVPVMIKAAAQTQVKDEASKQEIMKRTSAQKLMSFLEEVKKHVLNKMGATKDVLFEKIKNMAVVTAEQLLEAFQRKINDAPLDESAASKQVRIVVELVHSIVDDLKKVSSSIACIQNAFSQKGTH
jgi:hypothetical protein